MKTSYFPLRVVIAAFCILISMANLYFAADESVIAVTENLEILPISDHAYIHVSYHDLPGFPHCPANGLIYAIGGVAVIVDTPWTDGLTGALIDWVEAELDVKVNAVIVTHWHNDCMGGLAEVKNREIASYGSKPTIDAAKANGLPVPQHSFPVFVALRWSGHIVFGQYFGAGHTADNIVAWVPEEKILFGGCLIKSMAARSLGNLDDAVIEEWPETLEKILESYPDCETVVPGHGAHGGPELIEHTLKLLEEHE